MSRMVVIVVAAAFFLTGNLLAADTAKQSSKENKTAQTKCPVMGDEVNKKLFVDYNGKRIYVCCSGCISEVKANPEKYIKEMEAKGIVLDKIPKNEASADNKTVKPEKK